ncbi:hypothetical protein, partial [Bradyrhizobium sp. 33ap4]|uniref:hypothetical protein n=1 Tax=Bradyrhizobium sp. 33ap4 TaxID=3061630 RepID=UPI0029311675
SKRSEIGFGALWFTSERSQAGRKERARLEDDKEGEKGRVAMVTAAKSRASLLQQCFRSTT